MGGVWKAIKSVFKSVVDFVGDLLDAVWQFCVDYIIEPIMNFLGFKDEKIVTTSVSVTKIFDEDLLDKTRKELAIEKMLDGYDAFEYATNFSKTGEQQFSRYYTRGKYNYTDELPFAQIDSVSLDGLAVQDILESINNESVKIIDIENRVPTDIVWCKWLLQERYGYDISSDTLVLDGSYYSYESQQYNTSNGTCTVKLQTIPKITKNIYTITEITVENINEKEDLVTTSVSVQEDWYRTDTYSYLGTNISNPEITEEIVPTGTVIAGTTKTLDDIIEETVTSTTKQYVLEYHKGKNYCIATYALSEGVIKYWIYDTDTNIYPSISSPAKQVKDIDMYPVVLLRNNCFNVSDYAKDTINGKRRPISITKQRYEETVDILSSVGIDLDELTKAYSENDQINDVVDAFFMFGVSPADTSPAVSKALWEIFDFVYDTMPFVPMVTSDHQQNNMYSCTFREMPFNAVMTWRPSNSIEKEESIGPVGTHKHYIATQQLVTKKYTYSTYKYLNRKSHDYDSGEDEYLHDVSSYIYYETYRNDVLVGTYTDEKTVKTTRQWLDRIRTSPSKSLESTTKEDSKEIVITKQITPTTTKTMYITSFSAFDIVKRDSDSGGVTLEADNKNLLIPLPVPVVERLSLMDRTEILGCAAHLVFYALKVEHLKWYETERFAKFIQIIMIVIVIIIIILSWGTLSWATAPLMALKTVLMHVVIATCVTLALKFIASNVSSTKLKIVLSVATMVVGAWAGGMTFDLSWTTAFFLTSMCTYAVDLYLGDKMEDLQNEIESFRPEAEKRLQEQEDLLKELNEGISTSQIADWVTDIGQTSTAVASLMLPDQFFYIAKGDASRNFDTMYTGFYDSSVHKCIDNMKRIGFLGE